MLHGIHNQTTIMTNILVFLDTTWNYDFVADYLNFVLQRLNINPFASNVTLISAGDATIMVNTTNYLSELYENWNVTTHSWYKPGFNLPQILNTALDYAQRIMDADRRSGSLGGQSLIALLVPSPVAFVAEWDERYVLGFLDKLNQTVPDLNFIYYGGGALVRFRQFVRDPHEDLFPLDDERSPWRAGTPVVRRISKVPRRLVNPRCGADWQSNAQGPNQMKQYVRLGGINFYRISPNYFYGDGAMRYLRITPQNAASFTVCSSRTLTLPHRNDSAGQQAQECGQTAVTNGYSVDLTDLCTGYEYITQCPPMYVSVQAHASAASNEISCSNAACQWPSEAQFLIYVNNLVCNGGKIVSMSAVATLLALTIMPCFFI